MNMQMLYVELYVSSLIAIFVYVLVELFNIEKETDPMQQTKAAVARPRSAVWFFYAGIVAVVVGVLAFCASAVVESIVNSGDSSIRALSLIAGLLNPLFFVGVPLGIYWLNRSKQQSVTKR